MKMTPELTRSLVQALNQKIMCPTPVWLMRQAGRYLPEYRALRAKAGDFWTMCTTPELAAEVTLQPLRRFDLDAAIVFSDILTIPAALGQAVRIEDGIGPRLAEFPCVDRLENDPSRRQNALRPVYDALRIVRAALSPEKTLIGFAGAPWTLATYMLGGNGTPDERKMRAKASPDLQELLILLTDAVATHLASQIRAGADVVQLFDSWAGELRDDEFEAFVIRPTSSAMTTLRRQVADARVIGFPRGATPEQYRRYVQATAVNGISLHTEADIGNAAREFSGSVTLQGNLDPVVLVKGGDALNVAIDAILSATRDLPFIFNLGHGVVPETPPEHVDQLVRRVHQMSAP